MPAAFPLVRHRLTDDQRDLALTCLPLACLLGRRAGDRRPWMRGDYRDAATDGLIYAAGDYREKRAKFTTFVTLAVKSKFSAAYRRRTAECRDPRRVSPWPVDYDVPAPPEPEPDDLPPDWLDSVLALLSPREADVIRMRFVEGLTYKQIGARLGMTREGARQVEVRTLAVLRSHPALAEYRPDDDA